jgi:predicted ATPase
MFIKTLKVSGLLSFGPTGIDLPFEPLNVLIGPNGSGKSNLLEVLALLAAAPRSLSLAMNEQGLEHWFSKTMDLPAQADLQVIVKELPGKQPLRHTLKLARVGQHLLVVAESIHAEGGSLDPEVFYQLRLGARALYSEQQVARQLLPALFDPDESILSQVRDPYLYPALFWLQTHYESIRLFRNWSFGPGAAIRRAQSTHNRSDFLTDGGENLASVLSKIRPRVRRELLESLARLYEGIVDFDVQIDGGNALLFLDEGGGRSIPATRLSDGTLRYLCLLAILHHPDPPAVVAIEEPELGLHPDLIPHIAELLVRASERCQLFVTTHSPVLVDALGDRPSAVVVCEKHEGESCFRRLDPDAMKIWLEKYSLGELWTSGEIGGNRW